MDDHWENEVTEYGAVNITGFRIVDHSRKIVRDFMDGLRRMDPRFKGTISVSTTLPIRCTTLNYNDYRINYRIPFYADCEFWLSYL